MGGGWSLQSIKELHSEKKGQLGPSVTSPAPASLHSLQSKNLNFHTEGSYVLPKLGFYEYRILEKKNRADLGMYNLDFHKIYREREKEKEAPLARREIPSSPAGIQGEQTDFLSPQYPPTLR